MARRNLVSRPWIIAYVIMGLAAIGLVWWLALNDWQLVSLIKSTVRAGAGQGAAMVNFTGTYEIEGDDYSGLLTIRPAGSGYNLTWEIDDSTYLYGNGLVVGEVLGVVCATENGKRVRVAAYKKDGEDITGIWVATHHDKYYCEKSRGAADLAASSEGLKGSYTVAGSNPNGSPYTGRIILAPTCNTYDVTWKMTSDTFYGTGITLGGVAVLGYANNMGVGVGVYDIKQSHLEGNWVYTDFDRLPHTSDIRTGSETVRLHQRDTTRAREPGGEHEYQP